MTLRLFSLDYCKCLFQPAGWKDANLLTRTVYYTALTGSTPIALRTGESSAIDEETSPTDTSLHLTRVCGNLFSTSKWMAQLQSRAKCFDALSLRTYVLYDCRRNLELPTRMRMHYTEAIANDVLVTLTQLFSCFELQQLLLCSTRWNKVPRDYMKTRSSTPNRRFRSSLTLGR